MGDPLRPLHAGTFRAFREAEEGSPHELLATVNGLYDVDSSVYASWR